MFADGGRERRHRNSREMQLFAACLHVYTLYLFVRSGGWLTIGREPSLCLSVTTAPSLLALRYETQSFGFGLRVLSVGFLSSGFRTQEHFPQGACPFPAHACVFLARFSLNHTLPPSALSKLILLSKIGFKIGESVESPKSSSSRQNSPLFDGVPSVPDGHDMLINIVIYYHNT
jgi:hypothetical protein